MVVRTQCNGLEVTGLLVGTTNARRYFSKRTRAVQLHLGDVEIECQLTPDFWHGQPEIHDPRLCEWLKFKVFHHQSGRMPIAMDLEQFGLNSFRLLPSSLDGRSAHQHSARFSPAA